MHRLSERQRAVVAAIAAGESFRVVAERLGISMSTVASHLRAARRKISSGARRIDLVRAWIARSATAMQAPFEDVTTLTSAEREVLRAVVAGKTNSEIAAQRGTAARTVANQVAAIFRKVGVRSRAELVAEMAREAARQRGEEGK